MKKLELYLGIALIIITTVLLCIFMFVLEYTAERLAIVSILSILGYLSSYLYIDSYIGRLETTSYFDGFDAARELHNEIN
jgi:hypothetical protein